MKDVTKKEAGEEGPFPGAHTILPPGLPSTSPWVLEAPASSSAHAEISWMRWCLQYSGEQGGGMWSFVTLPVLQFPADAQQQLRQGGMSLSLPLATVLAQHRSPTEPKEGCVSFLFKALFALLQIQKQAFSLFFFLGFFLLLLLSPKKKKKQHMS